MSSTIIPFGLGGSGGGGMNFFSFGTEDWDQPHDYTTFYSTDGWNTMKMMCSGDWNTYFNANVRIGNTVNNCNIMFYQCFNFNSPVIFPANFKGFTSGMFRSCNNFNSPLIFESDNITFTNPESMFMQTTKFDLPLNLKLEGNASSMFTSSGNHREDIHIQQVGTGLLECNSMFRHTNCLFNLYINGNRLNCYYLFGNTSNTYCNVGGNIHLSSTNKICCNGMFSYVSSLGSYSPLNIYINGECDAHDMFWYYNATKCPNIVFNGYVNTAISIFSRANIISNKITLRFPKGVGGLFLAFSNTNAAIDLYVNQNANIDCRNMLSNRDYTNYRTNIYCTNTSIFLQYKESGNSLTNTHITWDPTTNGRYNSFYNIYIYNNYS